MHLLPQNEDRVAEDVVDGVNGAVVHEVSGQRLIPEEVMVIQEGLRIVDHAVVLSIQVAPGVPLFRYLPF